MKPFQKMPSYKDWKSESSVRMAFRASDNVLKQIDSLVKLYHQKPESQLEITFQLYRATGYWIKHLDGKIKGADQRLDAIAALNRFIKAEFMRIFDVDAGEVEEVMTLAFGKPVHYVYEEKEVFNEARTVAYLIDEKSRRQFKLVFRNGLAYKRTEAGLVLYDTENVAGKDGKGEAIYVMDREGHIFAGAYGVGEFHHSSFLAGGWSMAAGVMKITEGQVVWISADSGHYHPGKQQLLNVVERLKTYKVSLRKVTVKQFVYETEGPFKGRPKQRGLDYVWDSTRADVFLSQR